ncbi:hypothetical protein GTV32_18035 [Gordonia sp. SID5947]|uniref:hypothetical protein n=1 Tax=Gordonia sp. SID5947 TaxID=2690315 RepID=UPI0013720DA6|nr:hypothetical protein [Gordonia sp. SID5947]MYR08084.1 hypothetical protein [Gordonia sp. SID5947]
MANDTQTVVYRSSMSGGPQWQFYSMPESVVGGADSMDSARAQYREALAFSLEVGLDHLPPVRELVEHEASKGSGVWVRGAIDSPSYDNALKFLTRYVESQPADEIGWFFEQPAASGDAILVPVEFEDTLQSITSQMTPFDSVWAVAQGKDPDGSEMLVWLALGGSEAVSDDDSGSSVNLADLGLTPDSPMIDVFKRVIDNAQQMHTEGKYALATV